MESVPAKSGNISQQCQPLLSMPNLRCGEAKIQSPCRILNAGISIRKFLKRNRIKSNKCRLRIQLMKRIGYTAWINSLFLDITKIINRTINFVKVRELSVNLSSWTSLEGSQITSKMNSINQNLTIEKWIFKKKIMFITTGVHQ